MCLGNVCLFVFDTFLSNFLFLNCPIFGQKSDFYALLAKIFKNKTLKKKVRKHSLVIFNSMVLVKIWLFLSIFFFFTLSNIQKFWRKKINF